ncbi:MAG: YccF domain-containing protein [Candidatus Nanopelagicales bacterium]
MRTLGNILWLVLAGWWLALGYVVAGIINFIFIITIPFGIASFRLANYSLWPFGRTVVRDQSFAPMSLIGNILWLFFGGLSMAVSNLIAGVLLCLTIVGFPLGIAAFKLAGLALMPLGARIVPSSSLANVNTPGVYVVG